MKSNESNSGKTERITSTEFQKYYGKYVKYIQETKQPIEVTKNGVLAFTIVPPEKADKLDLLDSLVGIIPDEGLTREAMREERMRDKYGLPE